MKIALTGSSGLVGSRIVELLGKEFTFTELKQEDGFDITDKDNVYKTLKDIDFDLFLHLAAYTSVDLAETEKETVHKVNVEGIKNIFDAVTYKNKKLIYISTDFVFDGQHPPYTENSIPNPIGYYGETKLEGEHIVKNHGMIVRFSYPYRAHYELKKDFVKTVKNLLQEGKTLRMVQNSLITPTFIDDIAYALKYLFSNFSPEVFHVVGADSMSPYNAGLLIARTFGLPEQLVQPTLYEEYFKDKAKRPQFSDMKNVKNNFYKMKSFEEGLKELKKQLA